MDVTAVVAVVAVTIYTTILELIKINANYNKFLIYCNFVMTIMEETMEVHNTTNT